MERSDSARPVLPSTNLYIGSGISSDWLQVVLRQQSLQGGQDRA